MPKKYKLDLKMFGQNIALIAERKVRCRKEFFRSLGFLPEVFAQDNVYY